MDESANTLERPAAEPTTAREVFLSWERFRLAYNLALAGVVLLAVLVTRDTTLLSDGRFWWHLAARALAANLCFGLGPWVEGWLRVAGEGGFGTRAVLVVLGTGLATVLAAASVFSYGQPAWD
jgi:hypothetical protein